MRDESFIQEAMAKIKQADQAAEDLRLQLGLPPEAKGSLLKGMYGSPQRRAISPQLLHPYHVLESFLRTRPDMKPFLTTLRTIRDLVVSLPREQLALPRRQSALGSLAVGFGDASTLVDDLISLTSWAQLHQPVSESALLTEARARELPDDVAEPLAHYLAGELAGPISG